MSLVYRGVTVYTPSLDDDTLKTKPQCRTWSREWPWGAGGGGKAVSSLPGLGAIVVWASLEEIAGYEAQWFNG